MPRDQYYLPTRRLVSQDDAAITQRPDVPRSRFTGSWTRKTTFDAGYIVPFLIDEVLPGDHLSYTVTAYVRMSTPLFPLMDNQRIDTFFFFVPNRILWEHWANFQGEQVNPGDSIAYVPPTVSSPNGGWAINTIFDHMGLPVAGQIDALQAITVSALPFRAYNRIYNDWFRDQNVMGSVTVRIADTGDVTADFALMRRAKSHDYFTSALPWPQKFTAPTVPLGGLAPIIGLGLNSQAYQTGPSGTIYESNLASRTYPFYQETGTAPLYYEGTAAAGGYPKIFADLSTATGVAINTFRQAFLVQQLLERDARGGTRYVELIRSHFGVTNPDFRLQRPEYIGGGQTPLNNTPIAQTAPTAGAPVGALGAATTGAGTHRASYAATEHGLILGFINIRSELAYQQGIHKLWQRTTRYDYYMPSLGGLGEQAILRQEIYATGDNALDVTVFGYQERWHEYRTHTSEVTGQFRSTTTGPIDMWHLAQRFLTPPTLSAAFLVDDPPMARVLAAGVLAVNQQYLADILIERTAVRPIPQFGTPATLGRF